MGVKTDDQATCMEAGFLDNALVMIAVLEKNGRVIAWNHAAETITGYRQDEVIGRSQIWKHLYPDEEYPQKCDPQDCGYPCNKKLF